jgi:hypothetical protein
MTELISEDTLILITPAGVNFINIIRTNISYEHRFSS